MAKRNTARVVTFAERIERQREKLDKAKSRQQEIHDDLAAFLERNNPFRAGESERERLARTPPRLFKGGK